MVSAAPVEKPVLNRRRWPVFTWRRQGPFEIAGKSMRDCDRRGCVSAIVELRWRAVFAALTLRLRLLLPLRGE